MNAVFEMLWTGAAAIAAPANIEGAAEAAWDAAHQAAREQARLMAYIAADNDTFRAHPELWEEDEGILRPTPEATRIAESLAETYYQQVVERATEAALVAATNAAALESTVREAEETARKARLGFVISFNAPGIAYRAAREAAKEALTR
jgi:hypothetical protein